MAVAITRTADPASVAVASNYATYTSVSIGTASQSRCIYVTATSNVASGFSGTLPATINSGDGPIPMVFSGAQGFGTVAAGIWAAHVPSGTTATIAIPFISATAAINNNKISVYSVTGGRPPSITAFFQSTYFLNTSTDMDSTAPLTSGSVTIPTNGGAIAVAACGTAGTTLKTWANITEDLEDSTTVYTHTTATRTTSGTVTITCTGTTNQEDGSLAVVVLFPALTAYIYGDDNHQQTTIRGHFPPVPFPNDLRTWLVAPHQPSPPSYVPSRVVEWGMWTDPRVAKTWVDFSIDLRPPGVLIDTTKIPSRVVDWGMWIDPRVAMTWARTPLFAAQIFPKPVNQSDWPVLIAAAYPTSLRSWLLSPQQVAATPSVTYLPSRVTDWGMWTDSRVALTWTQRPEFTAPVVSPAQIPSRVVDWGSWLDPRSVRTWTATPMFATPVIPPAGTYMPSRVVDWGSMRDPRGRPAPTFIRGVTAKDPDVDTTHIPSRVVDWGASVPQARKAITFVRGPVAAPVDVDTTHMPCRVVDWGTQWQYPRRAITFVRAATGVDAVITPPPTMMPSRVVDWGTGWQYPRRALTFVRGVAAVQANFMPCRVVDWGGQFERIRFIAAPFQSNIAALTAPTVQKPVNNFAISGALPIRSVSFLQAAMQSTIAVLTTPPPPRPINQYDWPLPRAYEQKADGYSSTFSANPATIFVPPKPINQSHWPLAIAWGTRGAGYYPDSLRTVTSLPPIPFHGVAPSAPGSGAPRNIPFIATMGAMTAR